MSLFDDLDNFYRDQNESGADEGPQTDEQRRKSAEKLMDWLHKNPILLRYIAHIKGNNSQNTLPEHAIGERLYAILTCCLAARGDLPIVAPRVEELAGTEDSDVFYRRAAMGVAIMLLKAQCYLWTDKMEKLADAAPLPPHTTSRSLLPMPLMFWSRETRYVFPDSFGREAANNWIALIHHTDQVFILSDISYHDTQETKLAISHMKYGGVWPNDYDNSNELALILKRCAFLSSPFVVTDRRRMTHTARRQLERDHHVPRDVCNEQECHVVALRRLKFKTPQKASGEPSGVEWKHHWWVSAHYRAQWLPSEQAHRVIWIEPYLKGDLSKPLLEKVYAVVR